MRYQIGKIIIILLFALLCACQPASAGNLPVNAYFFYGIGCPHCAAEKEYLEILKEEYPDLEIHEYEIYHNMDNAGLLKQVAGKLGARVDGVPFLVIGDKHFTGYAGDTTAQMIGQQVKTCSLEKCPDPVAEIEETRQGQLPPENDVPDGQDEDTQDASSSSQDVRSKIISLPVLGEFDAMDFSLPLLTVVMGSLDGFNPCAMWTLLFLISLLLGMKDRKRMWILGVTFIVASASVYFLFMSAWLNLILFLGFVIWIRMLIGVLALLGGAYSLKEFAYNKEAGCKITGDEKRRKTFEKLKAAVQQNSLPLALGGIIVLAFAVNLVELICSAGLPAIYTQVLALNDMAGWNYYLYILLYIFFFMLDDLFVFFVAMITLEMAGITTRYARTSRLVGGLVMLAIGILLIFKPEVLMFG